MKIAMAQINSTVGDLEGNVEKIRHYMRKTRREETDLIAFPELAITGYPPQDLLYEGGFVHENRRPPQPTKKPLSEIVHYDKWTS